MRVLLRASGLTLFATVSIWAVDHGTVTRYCGGCHSNQVKTAGVALDTNAVTANAAVWERAVKKLETRSMPPIGLPRPDDATYDSLVSSITAELDRAAAANPSPGRTDTFRRLNRTEYHNAIRDLLSLDVDVSALLPADESSHGFDNVTVADLSPTLLERYLGAAQKISRRAIGIPMRSPGGDTIPFPPDLTQEEHFEGLPLGTRGGAAVPYTFPLDAKYEFQLRLARDRNEHVEGLHDTHELELSLDGKRVATFTAKPPPAGQDHHAVDQDFKIRVPVTAGPHEISVAFVKRRSALPETERQPYQAHFNMDRHPRIQPAVYSISINGPYETTGPGDTPSRRRIFVCKPVTSVGEDACAKQIFSKLMGRAYRRPVVESDLTAPFRFYKEARRDGTFEDGVEMGLRAILVSPEFLFKVEQDPPGVPPHTVYRISNLELASRVSFFLWSSIPDDELLAADLQKPAVLEREVRRMLTDERSRALVNNFAEQWLYLRNLASMTPDMRAFPDFDDNLRQAFRQETELFFESILREDRSVLDLLRANYTFVNERLAKHYGIPNIYGSRFRRVTFPPDGVRGGLLRQGSILTVTSYATRTSPVLRGKWILSNILGVPPPPPPPDVPALKESVPLGKSLTMRQRIAEHRDNPACAGCHNLMDPVGFSLENYDAVGRWRTAEDGVPIDSEGSLPDGKQFHGAAGLQQALLARPDAFLNTFTEKLLIYSLGRGVEYYDEPSIRAIVQNAKSKDYRISEFILGVTRSTPFQMRRSR